MLAPTSNIFALHDYYVNARYQARVQASIQQAWVDDSTRQSLQSMLTTGSAFWIDTIARIRDADSGVTLESVFRDAAAQPAPPLVVVILYNLPNRDCHASASNGELCCQYDSDGTCIFEASDPTCADGLGRYTRHYVDPFAAVLERFSSVPVAVIIEPDSLPNLATNIEDRRCGNAATQAAYVQGISYAIQALSRRAPHAALYLDAGHGGWLGWPDKADEFLKVVARLGNNAAGSLRGFATNVANYQSLGTPCPASAFAENWPQLGQQYCARSPGAACCRDPCGLLANYNSANNEHNYVQLLAARAKLSPLSTLLPSPKFVIDTGRNGRDDMRADCANWCNIRGAAVGHAPTAQTALPLIDAYYWLKTPGESDGCTETLPSGEHCSRYDGSCGSADSIGSRNGEPRAPEAGAFFASQLADLSCRARPDKGSSWGGDSGADARLLSDETADRCPDVVTKATAEAEAEAAASAPEPSAPRYDWRQSASGDGSGRVAANGIGSSGGGLVDHVSHGVVISVTSSSQSPGSGTANRWLLVGALAFLGWFLYPRCEPHVRQLVGQERYQSAWRVARVVAAKMAVAAAQLAAAAQAVASAVLRTRNSSGGGMVESHGHTAVSPARLPTAEDVEDPLDVIE